MPNSVLIVDDNPVVRSAMRDLFESWTDWKIGGEAEDGVEAIRKAVELKPDLVLLDVSMPRLNGIEAASILKKMFPDVQIVVFTMFDDSLGSTLRSAVGVDLVVPKAEGLNGLVKAVNLLMAIGGPNKRNAKKALRAPSAT
jgi:DNA-binding NarL/FixJ family response regulator